MRLAVTIDTEEDNWGDYTRSSYTVENISRIPRLQELFASYGVRPTYLISYPVATSPLASDILGRYAAEGKCEIGTHPHPWNTPPLLEERCARNSFISNLPPVLQFEKIRTLTDTIAANFGIRPRSYRSGRWGFSDDIARHLIRLGYRVDTSILPVWDWSDEGGPDFSMRSAEPFVYELAEGAQTDGSLLEIPPSVGFLQSARPTATAVFRSIRKLPGGGKLTAALSKLGVLTLSSVSPELSRVSSMIGLASAMEARGVSVINVFFHSPSLLEGCTPFGRTAGDVQAMLKRIDAFLSFARARNATCATMSELSAESVGAARVEVL